MRDGSYDEDQTKYTEKKQLCFLFLINIFFFEHSVFASLFEFEFWLWPYSLLVESQRNRFHGDFDVPALRYEKKYRWLAERKRKKKHKYRKLVMCVEKKHAVQKNNILLLLFAMPFADNN